MRRALAGLAAAAALCAGCSGDDERDKPAPPPAPPLPAADSLDGSPPPLGRTLVLRKRYRFMGRARRADTLVTASRFTARVRDPSLVLPPGGRPYRIAVRWQDRGPDAFPLQWARFVLVDRGGRRLAGPGQSPTRRLRPDRRDSPKATTLTFALPRGYRPAELRLSSIVALWRFRAAWAAEPR